MSTAKMSELTLKTVIDIIDDEKKKVDEVERKDFVWDQFAKLASSGILALSLISFTVDFVRGAEGVACFHPSDTASGEELTLSQATFINQFCLNALPITENYPVYILGHGLILIFPHYMWSATFKGYLDGFFLNAVKIPHSGKSDIGEYSEESFCRVEKMQRKYGGHHEIFLLFLAKLIAQLVFSAIFIGISAHYFRDFGFSFNCTLEKVGHIIDDNITDFPCVYTSFRVLYVVWFIDMTLIVFMGALALYGVIWCFWKHGEQLGYYMVAEFAFQSLLEPSYFRLPRFLFTTYSPQQHSSLCCLKYDNPEKSIYPSIKNDLDFLSLVLYRSDPFYGRALRDILVSSPQGVTEWAVEGRVSF
jgi:hypothetical protein